MMAPALPRPQLGELSDSHLWGLAVLCVHLPSVNSWTELTLVQRGRGRWWVEQPHPLGKLEVVLKVSTACTTCHSTAAVMTACVCGPPAVRGRVCCVPHQRTGIQNVGGVCVQSAVSYRH